MNKILTSCLLALLLQPVQALAGCDDAVDLSPVINGWSQGLHNHRFISREQAGLQAADLEALAPAWVFALPETDAPRSQPVVTGNTVFIADGDRHLYALDRASGCERWRFDAGSMVRTAMRLVETRNGPVLTLGTLDAELIALDPSNGEQRWRLRVSDHPRAMISGSTAEHAGILYQGISSWEVFWAANPFYACCTFRGGVIAVDAANDALLWRAHTIEVEAYVTRSRWLLPDHKGPSGAPVWSHPAIDVERGRVYVGTGENYSSPATDTSDAILAFDMRDGSLAWKQQFTRGDAWNVACVSPVHHNCPEERGGDLDFGAPPILATVAGRDIVLAGQKSGQIFALDPDRDGELLWSAKPGGGGKAGGVHFGMAIHPGLGLLYVPISDRDVGLLGDSGEGSPRPSVHAIDIASGVARWTVDAPGDCLADGEPIDGCFRGFSAPVTVAGELLFAPTLDGVLRVFDANTGDSLWQFDTRREFSAVNGGTASGGAIDLGGAYIAQGEVYLSSGYGLVDQIPGNAFMVFRLDGKGN